MRVGEYKCGFCGVTEASGETFHTGNYSDSMICGECAQELFEKLPNQKKSKYKSSFCGLPQTHAHYFFSGYDKFICDLCVKKINKASRKRKKA